MKLMRKFVIFLCMLLVGAGIAVSQTWAPLNHQPGVNLGPMLQLRDGRIIAHEEQSGNASNWWVLTPDATGSYANGTWSSGGQLACWLQTVLFRVAGAAGWEDRSYRRRRVQQRIRRVDDLGCATHVFG